MLLQPFTHEVGNHVVVLLLEHDAKVHKRPATIMIIITGILSLFAEKSTITHSDHPNPEP